MSTGSSLQDQAWEHGRAYLKHAQQAVILCTNKSQAGSCSDVAPCVWPDMVQPELQAKDAELAALRARLGRVKGLVAAEDQPAGTASKAAELKVGQPTLFCLITVQFV